MNELIFKILFVVLWIVYILIRVPYAKKYKQIEKIKKENSTIEKFLLILLAVGLMIIPLLWALTPFLDAFEMGFPLWIRVLGLILSVLSIFYFQWIHKTLGDNWSPTLEINKKHKLIQTGPYKAVRHPMYTQIWIWTIAQIFIVSNFIAGFSGIIAWAILYFIRVSKEEKMLTNYFGETYKNYMKQSGRIFPKFSKN